jgi:hypothetical protein
MVVLGRLESDGEWQCELFEDNLHIEQLEHASAAIDAVTAQFGKHKLCLGTVLFLASTGRPGATSSRGARPPCSAARRSGST